MDRSLRLSQASGAWGSVITDEGSKPDILSRIAQTTAALTRLKPVWNDRSISLSSKIPLMRSLVTSIFLYACESWTLTAELQRRIQVKAMRCYRKINEEVSVKTQQAIRPREARLTTVKRCKLKWYGHVSCSSGPAKTILQGTVKGGRRQGRQEEVGRQHQEMDRPGGQQRKMEGTGCEVICGTPKTLTVRQGD